MLRLHRARVSSCTPSRGARSVCTVRPPEFRHQQYRDHFPQKTLPRIQPRPIVQLGKQWSAHRVQPNLMPSLPPKRFYSGSSSSSSANSPTPPPRPTQSRSPPPSSSPHNLPPGVGLEERSSKMLYYLIAVVLLMVGLSYLSVPFYRMFCQATGFGGTVREEALSADKFKPIDPSKAREVSVRFEGTVSRALPWKFEPSQAELRVVPGESALAFYRATNLLDEPVVGVATYNVTPSKAGPYFNKIQCFCFEEQRLLPKETVEMPVFFYLDPAMLDDFEMRNVDKLTLSYTFFRSLNDQMV